MKEVLRTVNEYRQGVPQIQKEFEKWVEKNDVVDTDNLSLLQEHDEALNIAEEKFSLTELEMKKYFDTLQKQFNALRDIEKMIHAANVRSHNNVVEYKEWEELKKQGTKSSTLFLENN